jgi:hypothetical protein
MRIELSMLGEGQYVEMKDPHRLKWAEQKSMAAALKDGDTADVGNGLEFAEKIALWMVKGGYLLDDDNKPIVFPLTAETVGEVPAIVIEEVAKSFAEARKEAASKN